jgi:hypothetical protein
MFHLGRYLQLLKTCHLHLQETARFLADQHAIRAAARVSGQT